MSPRVGLFLLVAAFLAGSASAQTLGLDGTEVEEVPALPGQQVIDGTITIETLQLGQETLEISPRAVPVVRARNAPGAVLRGLDKVSGNVTDMELEVGESGRFGTLTVSLTECRVPVGNPTGDAFAHLTVEAEGVEDPAFDGWMIASSPALSALDHPRYDVWVMRCSNV